jgi:glycosyltransferase involved in cell wall biosynthesis
MWRMTLGPRLARLGWFLERRIFPLAYRRTRICTLSTSSADEIREHLHLNDVHVIPPGISDEFSPGTHRSSTPLLVAVGRLAPVKRFDLLLHDFAEIAQAHPSCEFVIVGDGYLRTDLERTAHELGLGARLRFAGHVSDEELVELYQRAWIVVSRSLREGWGMTLTEAAKCATPSVATDISGHRDSVRNGISGLLVDPHTSLAPTILELLEHSARLEELQAGAQRYASELTWDRAAIDLFRQLEASVHPRNR